LKERLDSFDKIDIIDDFFKKVKEN